MTTTLANASGLRDFASPEARLQSRPPQGAKLDTLPSSTSQQPAQADGPTALYEFCDWRDVTPGIDRSRGILRGVKILGIRSQNGRVYLPEALTAAVALYEGAKVNVNHPKGHPRAPRDYQERIGVLRGVTVRGGEGLFGDFHFNPRHALAEQLLWDASHAPQNVGLSHNVEARLARRDQQWVVEAISRVVSVDLVADPATTAGLFEAAGDATGRLRQVERRPSQSQPPELDSVPLADLTCEHLRAARPDLVETLLRESQSELQTEIELLRRQAAELAAATRQSQRREQATALLAEYRLPPPGSSDPTSRAITSEAFVAALLEAADEASMRSLIAERAELVDAARRRGGHESTGDAPPARPVSRGPRGELPSPVLDTHSFVRALRG